MPLSPVIFMFVYSSGCLMNFPSLPLYILALHVNVAVSTYLVSIWSFPEDT